MSQVEARPLPTLGRRKTRQDFQDRVFGILSILQILSVFIQLCEAKFKLFIWRGIAVRIAPARRHPPQTSAPQRQL